MMPLVSVIIPVYNDAERLKTCLLALEKQSFPKDQFEVIVVNNNPNENLPPLISAVDLNLVYLDEKKPGSYAARNLALKHAQGEVLAFTDSDCIPDVNWLSNGLNCLNSDPKIGVVAGAINLFFKAATLTLTEIYEKHTAFNQMESANSGFNTTANWFSTKKMVVDAGGFEEGLKSNGDSILSHKIFKMGYQIKYCEGASLLHPARFKLAEIINKRKRIIGGRYDFLKAEGKVLVFGLLKACLSFLSSNLKRTAKVFKNNREEGIKLMWVSFILFFAILWESALLLLGKKSVR
jgi:glycosyltransferase involved in cell wall biosynthesis